MIELKLRRVAKAPLRFALDPAGWRYAFDSPPQYFPRPLCGSRAARL